MRKSVAGAVASVDDAVGSVVNSLVKAGMYKDTLIILSTDNGGPTDGADNNNMNNFPLRGCKGGYFDGGMRGVGLIHGAGLKRVGYVSDVLHHVTDWLPTLLTAAKQGAFESDESHDLQLGEGEIPFLPGDGMDNWLALSTGSPSARTEIIHVVQAEGSKLESHALRQGDVKLLWHPAGTDCSRSHPGWYPPPNRGPTYANFTIQCPPPPSKLDPCSEEQPCLFNISSDPCEHVNLATKHPNIVATMTERISEYRQHAVLNFVQHDPRSNPKNHGPEKDGYQGLYGPWLPLKEDAKYYPTNYSGPGYAQNPSKCGMHKDAWLPGDGAGVIGYVGPMSPDECCTTCSQTPGCLSAVWWGTPSGKRAAETCVLHKRSGPIAPYTPGNRTLVIPWEQKMQSEVALLV